MEAGFRLQDGTRVDVRTEKAKRRVVVEHRDPEGQLREFLLTFSETRAFSSALMGAAAEL